MSVHKHFDKICGIVLCFTLMLTLLFMNAESFGVLAANKTLGYESRLFDTSKVHSIDIVMDDWEGFLETCTNEEYTMCTVVIDGDAIKNVGIRAKGNTSLSSVASYGNNRYSFKIEFDQYDDTTSYYGLDKLCLNNIIQDNTYMKDYLVYQMIGEFGAAAPLCSYTYITVNGEEFGLYLAVEAVEDSFLTRNYGTNYGDLYKPDSMNMGGGRGNGKEFTPEDMEDMLESFDFSKIQMPSGDMQNPFGNIQIPSDDSESTLSNKETFESSEKNGSDRSDFGGFGGKNDFGGNGGFGGKNDFGGNGGFGGMGGFGGFGSNDVSLIYSGDDHNSYSNIFGNAKTTVTDTDKDRLIASLKELNEGTNIEEVVNIEDVIRYFVVHNFAVNFDSYTGSMIHNYYLYEKDGMMEMIPWDYNLAFGTFMGSSDATSLVNYPIDTPVSGGNVDSRPMLAWIFSNEEYTELYHTYFAEFLATFFENNSLAETIDTVSALIAPYIEKQPTEFCTYEDFQTGVATLKDFCLLRAESISGQLDGTIPATSDGQRQDSAALIDASSLNLSTMGSFGGGPSFGGSQSFGDRPSFGGDSSSGGRPSFGGNSSSGAGLQPSQTATKTAQETDRTNPFSQGGNLSMPDGMGFPGGMEFPGDMELPEGNEFPGDMTFPEGMEFPDGMEFPNSTEVPDSTEPSPDTSVPGDTEQPDNNSQWNQNGDRPSMNFSENGGQGFPFQGNSQTSGTNDSYSTQLLLLGISFLFLCGGLVFAILYGRKRL